MTRIKSALTANSGEGEASAAEWRRLVDERNLRRRAERQVARVESASVELTRFGVFRM